MLVFLFISSHDGTLLESFENKFPGFMSHIKQNMLSRGNISTVQHQLELDPRP